MITRPEKKSSKKKNLKVLEFVSKRSRKERKITKSGCRDEHVKKLASTKDLTSYIVFSI